MNQKVQGFEGTADIETQVEIIVHQFKVGQKRWPEEFVAVGPGDEVAVVELIEEKID